MLIAMLGAEIFGSDEERRLPECYTGRSTLFVSGDQPKMKESARWARRSPEPEFQMSVAFVNTDCVAGDRRIFAIKGTRFGADLDSASKYRSYRLNLRCGQGSVVSKCGIMTKVDNETSAVSKIRLSVSA